jgi:PAS domain S-box-containing protein
MDKNGATTAGRGSDALPGTPATATVDAHGIVTGWSAGAELLLGYPRQEAVGRSVTALLGSGGDAARQCEAASGELGGTVALRHRDGRRVEVRLRSYPSYDADGRAQQLVVVLEPEAASPRTEEATTEQAFAQSRLPVMIYDADLRTVRASAGAVRVLGRAEAQMRGRHITDLLPPHLCRKIEKAMRRVFETGEPEQLQVHGRPRPEARARTWSVTVSPLRTAQGQVGHVLVTAVDFTEQHRVHQRLALLNDISAQVGSTLDVTRTAQEMADAAVGRLADFVTIDLLDSLFRGVEPSPSRTGAVILRRAAQQSVLTGVPEALTEPGDLDHYPASAPPVRCLVTGRPSLHRVGDESINAWEAADPARAGVVRAFGIHSIMIVPLRARGITLGVAVLVRHRHQEPFEEDDLLLAQEIGARAAVAVDNARRFTLERTAALALQRSLLPQRLSAQQAVEVAHRYLPARPQAGVGGDWFDVIALSGARTALVVGDVVGHGLHATATMGRLRTAVRTLADIDLPPDELLVHLDDLVTHLAMEEGVAAEGRPGPQTPTELVATCLYMVYDPVARRCAAATAGHPPPVVMAPGGRAEFVDVPSGPPLGVGGLPFEAVEWEVPAGSVLALYTDGLVQGTERDLTQGLELLRRGLEEPALSLEDTCDKLIRALLPPQPLDDVALLVARTRALDQSHVASWDLASDPAAVAGARAEATKKLAAWGLRDIAFTTELIISELVTNAVRYGHPPIRLRLIRDSVLICEVSDRSSTAPHMRRARTFDEGGRGLLLVAQFATRWGTRQYAGGKVIWAEVALSDERP